MSEVVRQVPEWAKRVRHERLRRGWTRPHMAQQMCRVASRLRLGKLDEERMAEYVKRWEHGDVGAPDSRHQLVIAGVFGLSVSEMFGAVAHLVSDRPVTTSVYDLPHYRLAEDDKIRRRRFMAWLAALAAGTIALPDSVLQTIAAIKDQNPDTLSRITAKDVDNLRASTEIFQAWGHKVGGGLSRHAMIGQLGWAVHQLDVGVPASAELRSQWQSASAHLAGVVGFNSHDCGHEQQGRGLMALGFRLASEADNRPMQADALSWMANQAVHIGRPKTGLDLARHGFEFADDATPITRAILHTQKARAYGRMGGLRAVEREVGLAEQEYARIVPDDREREPWLYFYNEAEMYGDTGTAWHMLAWHDPEQGVRVRAAGEAGARLSLAAESYGSEFARSRTLCNLMAAGVYLRAKDPDAAIAVLKKDTFIIEARGIRSARVEGFTTDLQKVARPFTRRPDLREMVDSLVS